MRTTCFCKTSIRITFWKCRQPKNVVRISLWEKCGQHFFEKWYGHFIIFLKKKIQITFLRKFMDNFRHPNILKMRTTLQFKKNCTSFSCLWKVQTLKSRTWNVKHVNKHFQLSLPVNSHKFIHTLKSRSWNVKHANKHFQISLTVNSHIAIVKPFLQSVHIKAALLKIWDLNFDNFSEFKAYLPKS